MTRLHEAYHDVISGRRQSAAAAVLRSVLRPVSWMYGAAVTIRNLSFDCGLRRIRTVDVPVISIGNLTAGGTGKTPLVAETVRQLQEMGRRPGIVSRGYAADKTGFNDEKRVLDQLCPGVPHVQHPDRVKAAGDLMSGQSVDVIVVDDGFQHRRLARRLNVLLLDATNPLGYGFLLPRGLLREPKTGMKRADLVILTRADLVDCGRLQDIERLVERIAPELSGHIVRVRFRPVGLLAVDGTARSLDSIRGRSVLIVTAIGNPSGFTATCEDAGAQIAAKRFFPDHHHYRPSDLQSVLREAAEKSVDFVLTTVKDLVKIRTVLPDDSGVQGPPLLAVDISTQFDSPRDHDVFVMSLCQTLSEQPSAAGSESR